MPDMSAFGNRIKAGPASPRPSDTLLLMAAADMHKQQDQYPDLTPEEWKAWQELPTKKGSVMHMPDNKDSMEDAIRADPNGVLLKRGDPRVKSLPKDIEILNVPDRHDMLLGRPKPKEPLTS